jgi:hypothetical protein
MEQIEFFLEVCDFNAERIRSNPELSKAVDRLRAKTLRDAFAHYIYESMIVPMTPPGKEVPPVPLLSEISKMLKQNVVGWAQEWKREGEAGLLLHLLEVKFGEVSAGVESQVESAGSEQLRCWAEGLLTATSLEEVIKGSGVG